MSMITKTDKLKVPQKQTENINDDNNNNKEFLYGTIPIYNTGSVHLLKYSIIITTNKHTTAGMIIKVLYINTS